MVRVSVVVLDTLSSMPKPPSTAKSRSKSKSKSKSKSAPATFTLTQLTRTPGSVTASVLENDVRITNSRGEDLVLTTKTRYDVSHESLGVLAMIIKGFADIYSSPKQVRRALANAVPWVFSLPSADQKSATKELLKELLRAADSKDYTNFSLCLLEWRNTAEIYADPELLAELTRTGYPGDGPVISRPTLAK